MTWKSKRHPPPGALLFIICLNIVMEMYKVTHKQTTGSQLTKWLNSRWTGTAEVENHDTFAMHWHIGIGHTIYISPSDFVEHIIACSE